jgi:hypothetical protein
MVSITRFFENVVFSRNVTIALYEKWLYSYFYGGRDLAGGLAESAGKGAVLFRDCSVVQAIGGGGVYLSGTTCFFFRIPPFPVSLRNLSNV